MNFKVEFAKLLLEILPNQELNSIIKNIEIPPSLELGDFCYPVFNFAKILKKNPNLIAKDFCIVLQNLNSKIFEFSVINAYINAKVKKDIFYKNIIEKILLQGNNYGKNINKESIEYTIDTFNTNPFKALHIGHLRNIITGESIYRLLEFTNQKPHPVYYGGDVGTHVSKWYWYYSKLNSKEQEIPKKNISKWFGEIYLKAGSKLKENPLLEKEVSLVQKQILENTVLQEKIKKLSDICFNSYLDVKKELDIHLEKYIFESQSQEEFFKIKEKIFSENKDIIIKDQNTIIADLKKFNLDVLVLVKDNGAPLYAAKDIGLVNLKKNLFPKSNNFLYIVGSEQKHYFKQLFKLFSFIYANTIHKHISYGIVKLGSQKMSSRVGGLILYEDFRDLVFKKVKAVLKENNLEHNIDIIKDISFGTIKFEMLKVGLNKNISFNINESLNLQGDSAVYIQYSGVRAQSILQKSNFENIININKENNLNLILKTINNYDLDEDEFKLLKLLNIFPEKVNFSANEFRPNIISNYCLELAHCFNKFYSNSTIICSNKTIKNRRLLLTKAYFIVLKNALNLLGINIPSAM